MQSAVGQALFEAPRRKQWAIILAVGTIAADFLLIIFQHNESIRLALGLSVFAVMVWLNNGDLTSLGLHPNPQQSWRWWIVTSLKLGLVVLAFIIVGLGIWTALGNDVPIYTTAPSKFLRTLLHMCFVAPVLEETIYRAIVCIPLVSAIGCWRTIAICGVLFGALHVAYGNPSPENLVGGFFLAWVYLKSETLLLPVLLHSLGNFVVLLSQVVGWYALNQP